MPVFAGPGVPNGAAERSRHGLKAVTHAEGGNAGGEQGRIDLRGTGGIDRLRAARQHDGLGFARQNLVDRGGVRHDLGVDARLADAPRDQLGVLGAEVDDEYQLVLVAHGTSV